MSKTFLILCLSATSFSELFSYASELILKGHKPTLLLDQKLGSNAEHACQSNKIDYILLPNTQPLSGFRFGAIRFFNLFSRFLYKLISKKAAIYAKAQAIKQQLLYQHTFLNGIFNKYHFDSVIIYSGRLLNWEAPLIKQARSRKIPVITPYFSAVPGASSRVMTKDGDEFSADIYPVIFTRNPSQVRNNPQTNKLIYYHPVSHLLAMESLGMMPRDPWVHGGNNADIVIVGSAKERLECIEEGADPKIIHAMGHMSHDVLYNNNSRRAEILKSLNSKYQLDPNRKLLVVAVPSLVEKVFFPNNKGIKYHHQLAKVLQKLNCNIILSFHPKMSLTKHGFYADIYGLKIASERLCDILPAADIFAACYSSTIQWAVLLNIPTICFDFDWIKIYPDAEVFFGKGVLTTRSPKSFTELVSQILKNNHLYAEIVGNLKETAKQMHPFDGRAKTRILNTLIQGVPVSFE